MVVWVFDVNSRVSRSAVRRSDEGCRGRRPLCARDSVLACILKRNTEQQENVSDGLRLSVCSRSYLYRYLHHRSTIKRGRSGRGNAGGVASSVRSFQTPQAFESAYRGRRVFSCNFRKRTSRNKPRSCAAPTARRHDVLLISKRQL